MQQKRGKARVIVPQNSKAQLIAIDPESFLKMVSESDATNAAISHPTPQRLLNDLKRS
ncbi:MAG: hypothetical protein SXA11_11580 [Cyanobacteriota bacterium]|nr:hypothetical protein [Cyanobacteriota bacterium]